MPLWGTGWSPLNWIFGWRHAPAIAGGPLPFPDLFTTPQQSQLAGGNLMDDNGFGPDSDTDVGRAIFCKIETKPTYQGGSVTIHQDGTFVYTPPDGFSGTDFFVYTLFDDLLRSRNSTVNVVVAPVKQLTVALIGGAFVWGTQIGDTFKLQFGKELAPAFAGGASMNAAISLHLVDYQGSAAMTADLFLYGEMGAAIKGGGSITKFNPEYGLKLDMVGGGTYNCPGVLTAELVAAFVGSGSFATAVVQPYFEMGVHFDGSGNDTTLGFLTTEHDFAIDFVAGGLLHTSSAYQTAHPDEGDSLGLQAYQNLPTGFTAGAAFAPGSFVIGLEGFKTKGSGLVTLDGLVSTFLTVGLDGGGIMNLYGSGVLGNGNSFDPQIFIGSANMGCDIEIGLAPVPFAGGASMGLPYGVLPPLLPTPAFTGSAIMASPLSAYVERGAAMTGSGQMAVSLVAGLSATFIQAATYNVNSSQLNTTANFGTPDANRYLILAVEAGSNVITFGTASINGVAATLLCKIDNVARSMAFYMAKVPTGTSGNITVNLTGTHTDAFKWAIWQMNGPFNTTPTATYAGVTGTHAITTVQGGMLFGGVNWGGFTSGINLDNNNTDVTSTDGQNFEVGHIATTANSTTVVDGGQYAAYVAFSP